MVCEGCGREYSNLRLYIGIRGDYVSLCEDCYAIVVKMERQRILKEIRKRLKNGSSRKSNTISQE
jgi:ribosome-binding protein aMBF1 (putative translation factor)